MLVGRRAKSHSKRAYVMGGFDVTISTTNILQGTEKENVDEVEWQGELLAGSGPGVLEPTPGMDSSLSKGCGPIGRETSCDDFR